jgi:hypothetical protein
VRAFSLEAAGSAGERVLSPAREVAGGSDHGDRPVPIAIGNRCAGAATLAGVRHPLSAARGEGARALVRAVAAWEDAVDGIDGRALLVADDPDAAGGSSERVSARRTLGDPAQRLRERAS